MIDISVIFPCLNEEKNIRKAVRNASGVLFSLTGAYEIIVVDDGSVDGTREAVENLRAENPRVRLLHHGRNIGYGAALKSGLRAARGKAVFFTDADLQFDLGELQNLLHWIDRYDIVAGFRVERRDPRIRRMSAWAWNRLIRLLFGLKVRDIDCAFKVFRADALRRLRIDSVGAFVNSEILIRAVKEGLRIKEVPVTHYPRVAGRPTGGNPRVILKAFRELAKFYREIGP